MGPIDMWTIRVGTEYATASDTADGVRWRVIERVGEIIDDDGVVPVYRCAQIAGDTTFYPSDRNPDGTIDMCGDAIAAALGTDGGDDD